MLASSTLLLERAPSLNIFRWTGLIKPRRNTNYWFSVSALYNGLRTSVSTHSYQCASKKSQQKNLMCHFLLLHYYQPRQQKKRGKKRIPVGLWKRELRKKNCWNHIAVLIRRAESSNLKQLAEMQASSSVQHYFLHIALKGCCIPHYCLSQPDKISVRIKAKAVE